MLDSQKVGEEKELIMSFIRQRNWGTELLGNLIKITHVKRHTENCPKQWGSRVYALLSSAYLIKGLRIVGILDNDFMVDSEQYQVFWTK